MAEIRTVGVIGSGTMGSGIAIVAARAGFPTIVYDSDAAALARARRQTAGFLEKSVERKRLSEAERERILGDIVGTERLEELAAADIVIEAVFEDLAVKHEVFAKTDRICGPGTIFASNTSTLSITEIAAGTGRADRFIGMHFCLPAPLMKLVEMSPGLSTDDAVFATAWAFCEAMGQRPVKTKDEPGFVLNALLVPYNNDAIRLVEAGVAEPADIDRAMKRGMGYPMGPLELIDLIGLDTQLLLCEALYGRTRDPRAACPPLVRRMIAAGFLGRKAGQGFYRYDRDAMFGG
ncbi:MAG: 3-hydroxyacyl-CoA dehydrogenase family protein [Stellaceae bacterium]